MTGSTPYSLEETGNFRRSLKKLATPALKSALQTELSQYLKEITLNPEHHKAAREPLSGRYSIPAEWQFYKLRFQISKGASGKMRLMYLVNESARSIILLWIYSHEQFSKRPSDADLRVVIQEALEQGKASPDP